jgi:hypothetical protein
MTTAIMWAYMQQSTITGELGGKGRNIVICIESFSCT